MEAKTKNFQIAAFRFFGGLRPAKSKKIPIGLSAQIHIWLDLEASQLPCPLQNLLFVGNFKVIKALCDLYVIRGMPGVLYVYVLQ